MHRHHLLSCLVVALIASAIVVSWAGVGAKEAEFDESKPIPVSGLVVDPAGNPTEARVKIVSVHGDVIAEAECGGDGKFQLSFVPSDIKRPLGRDWSDATLVANADGYAPAWIRAGDLKLDLHPTLRLVPDDVTVSVQIVDSDGRPVEAAEIELYSILHPEDDSLDPYLKQQRDEPMRSSRFASDHMVYLPPGATDITVLKGRRSQAARPEGETVDVFLTDEAGRLELKGIGRERKLYIGVSGPNIIAELFHVVTRDRIDPKWKRTKLSRAARIEIESGGTLPKVYAAKFTHVGSPSRPIVGMVRDHESGQPLAGVGISAQMKGSPGRGYAKTDASGRYELTGLPTSGTVSLYAVCPDGMPYLNAEKDRIEFSAAAPVTNTDFELVQGVVIRGRLLDPAGNPTKGRVEYFGLTTNDYAQKMPDPLGPYGGHITSAEDGQFEVVAMQGPGLLVAKTYDDRFLPASLDGIDVPTNSRGYVSTINMGSIRAGQYDVIRPVSVAAGSEPLTIDMHLSSGDQIRGKLVDSVGQPIHGASARRITAAGYWKRLDTSDFVVSGLRPEERRLLMFRHKERRLGAVVNINGQSPKEIRVTMRPYATLTGRIVDGNGRPVSQAAFVLMSQGAEAAIKDEISGKIRGHKPLDFAEGMTNADGRFHIADAIPGCKCELLAATVDTQQKRGIPQLLKTLSLRSGETRDLGDLELEPEE
jgi:hypothetical protein